LKGSRIETLKPRIATLDTRTAKPMPKVVDDHYNTPEHRAWALEVKRRAGWRCEAIVDGFRCKNHHPTSKIYADHIVEVQDDPLRKLDPTNGAARCASCHTKKTIAVRAKRLGQKY
jgi:hypothetical protein